MCSVKTNVADALFFNPGMSRRPELGTWRNARLQRAALSRLQDLGVAHFIFFFATAAVWLG
jgi:hypothetical protein